RPSERRQLLAALLVVLVAMVVVVILRPTSKHPPAPPRPVASMFQDDDHLLYSSTPVVTHTLKMLKALGVGELRATMLWKAIAPDPLGRRAPTGFAAGDPAAYPLVAWAPYDRLVTLARARGMVVDFVLSAPGPMWAM